MRLPNMQDALTWMDELCRSAPATIPCVENDADGVILYGAGNLGVLALRFLDNVGVPIKYVIDRSPAHPFLCGRVKIYPLSYAPESRNAPVLVSTVSAPFTEIKRNLASLGFRQVLPFYDFAQLHANRHPLNNGWFSGPLSTEDRAGIESVLASLQDPLSRAAYLQFLAWRVLRRDWVFEEAPVTGEGRFFIEPVIESLTEHEDYVDAGAYDGRVFMRFLEITQNRFSSAMLVEPDSLNVEMLQRTLGNLPADIRSNARVMPCVLGNCRRRMPFSHGFDLTSRLWESAPQSADCIRLDDLDAPVSFLKLHLEGGEHDALQGGIDTLRRCRPLLAATLYHTRDGLWKTLSWLRQNLDDYHFLLRLHSWCGTGFVVYALPRKRQGA